MATEVSVRTSMGTCRTTRFHLHGDYAPVAALDDQIDLLAVAMNPRVPSLSLCSLGIHAQAQRPQRLEQAAQQQGRWGGMRGPASTPLSVVEALR